MRLFFLFLTVALMVLWVDIVLGSSPATICSGTDTSTYSRTSCPSSCPKDVYFCPKGSNDCQQCWEDEGPQCAQPYVCVKPSPRVLEPEVHS